MAKLTEEQAKRVLDAWEKPLSLPRPAPKSEPKKRGRKPKEQQNTEE